jgi:hypothetical protein
MSALANAGINVMSTHSITKSNALHLAVEREYSNIVSMLVKSGYPLD